MKSGLIDSGRVVDHSADVISNMVRGKEPLLELRTFADGNIYIDFILYVSGIEIHLNKTNQ